MKARRYNQRERESFLDSFLKSGLSIRMFCEKSDLEPDRLRYWLREIKKREKASPIPSKIELSEICISSKDPVCEKHFQVELPNNLRLHLSCDTPEEFTCLVRRLIQC